VTTLVAPKEGSNRALVWYDTEAMARREIKILAKPRGPVVSYNRRLFNVWRNESAFGKASKEWQDHSKCGESSAANVGYAHIWRERLERKLRLSIVRSWGHVASHVWTKNQRYLSEAGKYIWRKHLDAELHAFGFDYLNPHNKHLFDHSRVDLTNLEHRHWTAKTVAYTSIQTMDEGRSWQAQIRVPQGYYSFAVGTHFGWPGCQCFSPFFGYKRDAFAWVEAYAEAMKTLKRRATDYPEDWQPVSNPVPGRLLSRGRWNP